MVGGDGVPCHLQGSRWSTTELCIGFPGFLSVAISFSRMLATSHAHPEDCLDYSWERDQDHVIIFGPALGR